MKKPEKLKAVPNKPPMDYAPQLMMPMGVMLAPNEVVVPVKSAWQSKIVWTQIVAVLAMVGTLFGIDLPTELQAEIVGGIVLLQGGVTFVLKTWFTNTVTPASVPPTAMVE